MPQRVLTQSWANVETVAGFLGYPVLVDANECLDEF